MPTTQARRLNSSLRSVGNDDLGSLAQNHGLDSMVVRSPIEKTYGHSSSCPTMTDSHVVREPTRHGENEIVIQD